MHIQYQSTDHKRDQNMLGINTLFMAYTAQKTRAKKKKDIKNVPEGAFQI